MSGYSTCPGNHRKVIHQLASEKISGNMIVKEEEMDRGHSRGSDVVHVNESKSEQRQNSQASRWVNPCTVLRRSVQRRSEKKNRFMKENEMGRGDPVHCLTVLARRHVSGTETERSAKLPDK